MPNSPKPALERAAYSMIYRSTRIAPPYSAMRNLLQDVRFGLRVLWASPVFAAVAVLTTGLGIACTTTVFSWIDAVLLHPYPGASRSDELAVLEMIIPGAPNGGTSLSWVDYRDYRDRSRTLSGLAMWRQCAFTLGDGEKARLAWGELVSGNYFEVMGVKPQTGRAFTLEESGDSLGASPVAVISTHLWRDYFHSDPAIVGKTVRVNRHSLAIVGVAPPSFHGSWPVMQYDLWVPATMGAALGSVPERAFHERDYRGEFESICRLRPGVSVSSARSEVAALAASLAAVNPKTNFGVGATVLPTWEAHNGVNELMRAPLRILMAVSFLVLLVVCANVANLLLARSVARQREFGIRCAVGAGRSRLALQVLTETFVLAAGGAGVGIIMLMWMQGAMLAMLPNVGFPVAVAYTLNPRLLLFTAAACVVTALISGASPALFVFRSNLNEVLKEGSRSDAAGAASRRTRGFLAIGEVALAAVALIAAGLFMRSFQKLRAIQPGFDSANVLVGRFFIETAGYSGEQIRQFSLRLKERLLTSPEIESVSYSDVIPLTTTAGPYNDLTVEGYTPKPNESLSVNRAIVGPDYFAAMRIPILEGREFNERDDPAAEPVIIVNQTFARRYYRGESPVGRKVRAGGRLCRVIGLARDSRYFSPGESSRPFFYLSFQQIVNPFPEFYVMLRTRISPNQAIPILRRAVAQTDSNASAYHAISLAEYIEIATFGQKVAARLMGSLALMCLLLASLGLYSVMSYTVSQRISEIGIRMAMGASPWNVIAMVVGQGMRLALAGIVLGTLAAFAFTRFIASMLTGVDASDPATFALAALFLLTVTLLATSLPAFRATRIDPLPALRK